MQQNPQNNINREYVCLFRGLREHERNFPSSEIKFLKRLAKHTGSIKHKANCLKYHNEGSPSFQDVQNRTDAALDNDAFILRYLDEHAAYIQINKYYAFLSYSKIPERAYHYASYLKKYNQLNTLGAILITIIPREDYEQLRKLDVVRWKNERGIQSGVQNFEVLLSSIAPVTAIVSVNTSLQDTDYIGGRADRYSKLCWKVAKKMVEKQNGTLVFADGNEELHRFDSPQIANWSNQVKAANQFQHVQNVQQVQQIQAQQVQAQQIQVQPIQAQQVQAQQIQVQEVQPQQIQVQEGQPQQGQQGQIQQI